MKLTSEWRDGSYHDVHSQYASKLEFSSGFCPNGNDLTRKLRGRCINPNSHMAWRHVVGITYVGYETWADLVVVLSEITYRHRYGLLP